MISSGLKTLIELNKGCCGMKLGIYIPLNMWRALVKKSLSLTLARVLMNTNTSIKEEKYKVNNILKYLRRTKDSLLIYGGHEKIVVIGYTDAIFQTDKDDF